MIEVKEHLNRDKYEGFGEFYYCPVIDGKDTNFIAETYDTALLVGLGIKYDGKYSQFPKMACRMLNIESEWTE